MTSSLAMRWTTLDTIIQKYRFRKVTPLIPQNSVLLDIGCGNGAFLRSLEKHLLKGIGIDQRVPHNNDKISYLEADIETVLPLQDESVDTVTALAVFEHLSAPGRLVSEAHRVLKKGGCLILTTPSPVAKPLLDFLAFRLKVISTEDIADHKKYYSAVELTAKLQVFSQTRVSFFQCGLNTLVFATK